MPRVLVAPNSFRGSISAAGAAGALGLGFAAAGWEVDLSPIADGGDGTAEVLAGHLPPGVAVVETAAHAGHRLGHDALGAGTEALGAAIVATGAAEVWLGLGGSRTTDGGTGLARAFGWQFLDAAGRDLPPGGGALVNLARIVEGRPAPRLVGLIDVASPLLDAAYVFAPQKGASPKDVETLAAGLRQLERVRGVTGDFPGAGAAGGLGYGVAALLGGQVVPGAKRILDALAFDRRLMGVDLCVTGEGAVDRQTALGKAPGEAARRAKAAGVAVVVAAGRVDADAARALGAVEVVALIDLGPDPMARAAEYLEEAGGLLARRYPPRP